MENTKSSTMLQAINYIPFGRDYLAPPDYTLEDTPVDPLPPSTTNTTNSTILNSTTTVTSTTTAPAKSTLLTPTNILIGTGIVCLVIFLSKK